MLDVMNPVIFMKLGEQLIRSELLEDPAMEFTDVSRQWVYNMVNHHVPVEKLRRACNLILCYRLLKAGQVTEDDNFLSAVLAWCIEWLHISFLIHDDLMENSHSRNGQLCWHNMNKVGMIAVNDGILVRNLVYRMLKNYFHQKPYYVDLLHLFNEVEFQTASGQMLDLIATQEAEKDISKFSMSQHRQIAQYKTAYHAAYLPLTCALVMAGENLDNHIDVKNILLDMGIYFHVQQDYLDCFEEFKNSTGKFGNHIQNFKCSWLVVKAWEICSEEQKKVLNENYGKPEDFNVEKVKALYNELDIKGLYEKHKRESYKMLISTVEAHPCKAMRRVLSFSFTLIQKRGGLII